MNSAEPDFLTLSDVIDIASGILPSVDIRDLGLLESAVARPRISVFGEPAYPDLLTQAATLLHSLARNHPLVDGNKRLAWATMRVFLLINGVGVSYDLDDAETMVLNVAMGDLDVKGIASWLAGNIERVKPEDN